jgi:hypothetical protein
VDVDINGITAKFLQDNGLDMVDVVLAAAALHGLGASGARVVGSKGCGWAHAKE